MQLTETQLSLSHILAHHGFVDHKDYHETLLAINGHCDFCDTLQDLENYIQAKVIQVAPLCYNCDGVMKKDHIGLKCNDCGARRADGVEKEITRKEEDEDK